MSEKVYLGWSIWVCVFGIWDGVFDIVRSQLSGVKVQGSIELPSYGKKSLYLSWIWRLLWSVPHPLWLAMWRSANKSSYINYSAKFMKGASLFCPLVFFKNIPIKFCLQKYLPQIFLQTIPLKFVFKFGPKNIHLKLRAVNLPRSSCSSASRHSKKV